MYSLVLPRENRFNMSREMHSLVCTSIEKQDGRIGVTLNLDICIRKTASALLSEIYSYLYTIAINVKSGRYSIGVFNRFQSYLLLMSTI